MALHSLRFRLVDSPTSLAAKRRARRAAWLSDTFPNLAEMTVLDLGGRVEGWARVPDWVAPGMQFLPVSARVVMARRWPLAYTPGKSYEAAMRQVLTTELIGRAELRYLFPDAVVRNERLAGLTKSLIAVRA